MIGPRKIRATMMMIAMRARSRPYSTSVWPSSSSLWKRARRVLMKFLIMCLGPPFRRDLRWQRTVPRTRRTWPNGPAAPSAEPYHAVDVHPLSSPPRPQTTGAAPCGAAPVAPEEETRGPDVEASVPWMKAAADTRDDVLRTLRGPTPSLHGTPVHRAVGLPTGKQMAPLRRATPPGQ